MTQQRAREEYGRIPSYTVVLAAEARAETLSGRIWKSVHRADQEGNRTIDGSGEEKPGLRQQESVTSAPDQRPDVCMNMPMHSDA